MIKVTLGSPASVAQKSIVSGERARITILAVSAVVVAAVAAAIQFMPGQAPPLSTTASPTFRGLPRACQDGEPLAEPTSARDVSWSPDGSVAAITLTTATRARPNEQPRVSLLRGPTWTRSDIAAGSSPRWSSDGRYLAFRAHAPDDRIEIFDVVRSTKAGEVTSDGVDYAWLGQRLVYWVGSDIHAWEGGATRTLSSVRLGAYRQSNAFFSSDGAAFLVYGLDQASESTGYLVGETESGVTTEVTDLRKKPTWSGFDQTLLVVGDSTVGLRLADGKTLETGRTRVPTDVVLWVPAPHTALVGRATTQNDPSTSFVTLQYWDGVALGPTAIVPWMTPEEAFRSRFSPDGTRLAVISFAPDKSSLNLRMFRCTAGA
jgi:dipeptidyl aminopeptidase/acylaminoacyl peptidase